MTLPILRETYQAFFGTSTVALPTMPIGSFASAIKPTGECIFIDSGVTCIRSCTSDEGISAMGSLAIGPLLSCVYD